MSEIKVTDWVSLHDRARNLLKTKYDKLTDWERDYLVSIESRKIVWGTQMQVQRLDEIEGKFKNEINR